MILALPFFCDLFGTIKAIQLTVLLYSEFSQLATATFGSLNVNQIFVHYMMNTWNPFVLF